MTIEEYKNDELIAQAVSRNIISLEGDRVIYNIHQKSHTVLEIV